MKTSRHLQTSFTVLVPFQRIQVFKERLTPGANVIFLDLHPTPYYVMMRVFADARTQGA